MIWRWDGFFFFFRSAWCTEALPPLRGPEPLVLSVEPIAWFCSFSGTQTQREKIPEHRSPSHWQAVMLKVMKKVPYRSCALFFCGTRGCCTGVGFFYCISVLFLVTDCSVVGVLEERREDLSGAGGVFYLLQWCMLLSPC